jgi:hypothetical protein
MATQTPDDGRDTASFAFGERTVVLRQPTSGQLFVILQLLDIQNETDVQLQIEACNNFGTVLRTCIVQDADRQYIQGGLARGIFDLPDYFGLAQEMILHWAPEQVGNRETRRAAGQRRAPAKKAIAKRASGRA